MLAAAGKRRLRHDPAVGCLQCMSPPLFTCMIFISDSPSAQSSIFSHRLLSKVLSQAKFVLLVGWVKGREDKGQVWRASRNTKAEEGRMQIGGREASQAGAAQQRCLKLHAAAAARAAATSQLLHWCAQSACWRDDSAGCGWEEGRAEVGSRHRHLTHKLADSEGAASAQAVVQRLAWLCCSPSLFATAPQNPRSPRTPAQSVWGRQSCACAWQMGQSRAVL